MPLERDIKVSDLTAESLWTVVSLVDEEVTCSIHSSEFNAYLELAQRFERYESTVKQPDRVLRELVATGRKVGDFSQVRQYLRIKSTKMSSIQIAEHRAGLRTVVTA